MGELNEILQQFSANEYKIIIVGCEGNKTLLDVNGMIILKCVSSKTVGVKKAGNVYQLLKSCLKHGQMQLRICVTTFRIYT